MSRVKIAPLALVFCALLSSRCPSPEQPGPQRRAEPAAALNPVTGQPLPELISEQEELKSAVRQHAAIAAAQSSGGALDPPNLRYAQLQKVFSNLVAVAHRPELPWQIHLIAS